jgi:glycosyltransferase involved in cell wall biosynthesis
MENVGFLIFKDHVIFCHDVISSARMWARRGHRAEIFAIDTGRIPQPSFHGEDICLRMTGTLYGRLRGLGRTLGGVRQGEEVHPAGGDVCGGGGEARCSLLRSFLEAAGRVLSALQKYEFVLATTVRLLAGRYRLLVAFDTPSLVAARIVSLFRGTPYVYHSRELLLTWDITSFSERIEKVIEGRCHRSAAFTIIQDEKRAELLSRDNGIPRNRFLIVPNAPLGEYGGGPTTVVADRHGLSSRSRVVLYAGSVTGETMMEETIDSMAGWPENTVLVVHGDVSISYRPLLRRSAARYPGRVFFSRDFVQPEDIDALFAGADIGLALYRPVNDNFRYVGLAAGKVFNFLKVGVPVIASDLPGLRELFHESGCGQTVSRPGEIGGAVASLLKDRESRRESCRKLFRRYEFSHTYRVAMDRIEAELTEPEG